MGGVYETQETYFLYFNQSLEIQSNLSNPGSVGPTGARMCENAQNSEYSTEETDR